MTQRVVIVGAVAAGSKAACRLRRLKPNWKITLIDEDDLISYGACGIPYFVSGDIPEEAQLRSTSYHALRDAEFFANAKGVEVQTRTRVVSIDRKTRTVIAKQLETGAELRLPYDQLLLATGATPLRPPIPGIDLDGVFAVANLHSAIEIRQRLTRGEVGTAVVIGGSGVGIEMTEALADLWGIPTTLIEAESRLLPKLVDWPLAAMVEAHLRDQDVTVHTGEPAIALAGGTPGEPIRVETPNRTIAADLVVVATGVRPRSELAIAAGLETSDNGAIVVNEHLQTSDPLIFAAGDCTATRHLLTGNPCHMPLGSLANRQARVAADNMAGNRSVFSGIVGSFIMKAFERCVAATGLSAERSRDAGFEPEVALAAAFDRAHFYPGQEILILQMVFDRRSRRVLGLQAFGPNGDAVLARVDAAAMPLASGAIVEDFINLEMAYAPPFSTAIDSLNAVASVADNLCAGRLHTVDLRRFIDWLRDTDQEQQWLALDVRPERESAALVDRIGADRWLAIPLEEIRRRHGELPAGKTLIIVCDAGARSYEVQVLLHSLGKIDTLVIQGGLHALRRIAPEIFRA